MRGQRHLLKCRCVLQHLKSRQDPPPHHFMTFSVIDDDDKVLIKYDQCNNCGLIHKVIDICTSEIMSGKESFSSVVTISDVKASLPQNLSDILERNNADKSMWELGQFLIENKRWGEIIVLSHEEEGGAKHGKYVRILSETFFKVDSFTREEFLSPG